MDFINNDREKLRHRILDYVKGDPNSNECWIFTGAIQQGSGYGKMSVNDTAEYAHRVSYFAFWGFIYEGHNICHHCDNKLCVNPYHLFQGSQQDNVDDMLSKGREVRGEDVHNSKLTRKDVKEIRGLIEYSDKTQTQIARQFSVSDSVISNIKHGKSWVHV